MNLKLKWLIAMAKEAIVGREPPACYGRPPCNSKQDASMLDCKNCEWKRDCWEGYE